MKGCGVHEGHTAALFLTRGDLGTSGSEVQEEGTMAD